MSSPQDHDGFIEQIDKLLLNCSLDELHHLNKELNVELEFRRFRQSRIDKLKRELADIKLANEIESSSEEEAPPKKAKPAPKKPVKK